MLAVMPAAYALKCAHIFARSLLDQLPEIGKGLLHLIHCDYHATCASLHGCMSTGRCAIQRFRMLKVSFSRLRLKSFVARCASASRRSAGVCGGAKYCSGAAIGLHDGEIRSHSCGYSKLNGAKKKIWHFARTDANQSAPCNLDLAFA